MHVLEGTRAVRARGVGRPVRSRRGGSRSEENRTHRHGARRHELAGLGHAAPAGCHSWSRAGFPSALAEHFGTVPPGRGREVAWSVPSGFWKSRMGITTVPAETGRTTARHRGRVDDVGISARAEVGRAARLHTLELIPRGPFGKPDGTPERTWRPPPRGTVPERFGKRVCETVGLGGDTRRPRASVGPRISGGFAADVRAAMACQSRRCGSRIPRPGRSLRRRPVRPLRRSRARRPGAAAPSAPGRAPRTDARSGSGPG